MSRISAEYFMELHGMTFERAALGGSLRLDREAYQCDIELPTTQDQYKYGTVTASPMSDDERRYVPTLTFVEPQPGSRLVEVRIIRVTVSTESELSATCYRGKNPAHAAAAQALFTKLWTWAHEATQEFTDTVRAHGQPWIEPRGVYPRPLNIISLFDVTEKNPLGFSIGRANDSFRVVGLDAIITASSLAAIEKMMQHEGPPGIGEVLVSDAFYLAEGEQANGPAQATLLAAMGVEVKTKAVLKRLAGEDKKNLLELLLENPRDWSLSAHGLFAKALPTLAGRELGDRHRELARRVQKLFTARNKVAHRGEPIDRQESKTHVATAQASINFLREVEV